MGFGESGLSFWVTYRAGYGLWLAGWINQAAGGPIFKKISPCYLYFKLLTPAPGVTFDQRKLINSYFSELLCF